MGNCRYSIDEALAGYANKIEVVIEKDNWIKVTDNGRGIPVDIQEKMAMSSCRSYFNCFTCWW